MLRRALTAAVLGGMICLSGPTSANATGIEPAPSVTYDFVERYRQALAIDPGNHTLHYLLGLALLNAERDKEALNAFRNAYPAYRESIEANFNLSIVSLRLGDIDSAQIYLDQAELLGAVEQPEIYPLANLYFNLALLAQEQGQENEAIRFFHKVLDLDPERREVYRQLGDLYARNGQTSLALSSFREYLSHYPGDTLSRDYLFALEFNRAQDLMAAGDLVGATEGFSAALEVQPGSPTVLYYLGYLAYSRDLPKSATDLLIEAYPTADRDLKDAIRPLLYNCSLALRRNDDNRTALYAVTELARSDEAAFKELFLAGTLSLETGEYRQAREYLDRAVALEPRHAGALQNLIAAESGSYTEWLIIARRALAAGQLVEASSALEEAAKLRPGTPQVVTLEKKVQRTITLEAEKHFTAAEDALGSGDFKNAAREVDLGLTLLPTDGEGLELRDRIAAAFTSNLTTLLEEGENRLALKNWAEARDAYAEVLSLQPNHQEATAGVRAAEEGFRSELAQRLSDGRKAFDAGDIDKASAAYMEVLEINPDDPDALEGLAATNELRSNRKKEYLRLGRRAIDRGRYGEARSWMAKAEKIATGQDIEDALGRLEQAIVKRVSALNDTGTRYTQEGRYKQADALFREALKLAPDHEKTLTNRSALKTSIKSAIEEGLIKGDRALMDGDHTAAMTAYRKVLDLAPDNQRAQQGLVKSRQQASADVTAIVNVAQKALDAGELDKASEQLAKAFSEDPYNKDVVQLKSRLEQVRLTGAAPGDEQQIYLQGISLYTQGRYQDAIKSWETVLALDPGHDKARLNIEKTQRKLKQIEEYRGG